MSLPDTGPLSKLPQKRLFDNGEHHGFPLNFKRPKVDAVRQFPEHCGALAPRIATGPREGVSGGKAARISEISVASDIKPESTKPLVSKNSVEAHGLGMTADQGEKASVKTMDATKSTNLPKNLTEAQPRACVRKYPPWKIRKVFTVHRDFPPGLVMRNHTSESTVWANKSGVDQRQLVETTRTDSKEQIQNGHDLESKLEGNALKEQGDEVQAESMRLTGNETGKNIESGTSSEYKVKQDRDMESSVAAPSEIRLLLPDFVSKIKESYSFVGQTGKELEEYCEDKGAENGSDMLISPGGAQYLDMNPPCGDWVIAKRDGEWVSTCEATEPICGFKSQKNEVEDAVILSVESSSLCGDALFDNKERHKPILVSKDCNVLSIIPHDSVQAVVSRNKVKEALNLFEETYTNLLKEQEAQSKGKGKVGRHCHVEAAMLLKKQKKCVNTKRVLGPVPGVEIGDRFRFRAELVVIGLHHQFQGGIDYIKKDGEIFATSIVDSGRYANVAESSNVLIYCGQGGNPTIVNKEPQDQQLERGNLALKNSMDAGKPVRVIRGRQILEASTSEKILTYLYDGLYSVTKCTQERGLFGKLVFMFELNRLAGQAAQPKLTREIASLPKKSKVCNAPKAANDISQGKEKKPICAVNNIDDEKIPPFDYVPNVEYPWWYDSSIPIGCDCIDGCSDLVKCPCTIKNGGEVPFNSYGAIVRKNPLVYECGPSCKCPPSCTNRVSQHGIQYQLEIFKTESRGWGVRSRNYISSGGFICEYAGELLRDKEAEERTGNDEYLFDIGKENNDNSPRDETSDGDNFTIDAATRGNVGRFINHSCSPNLYAQNVLYDHDNKRMPHIMLFAAKNVPPLRELTYDYNYKVNQVLDGNGNIKKKDCYCGSRNCSGRMY
ncbi:histone-lysine N-methyltransferase, H3 lysine-9 specific SUVH5-like [Actinidia eriantha]|uniref:histone-lysine N-methyltransferase, H3 lysine-9 specific SUVH5-like n=1 Tax=Actinidia eriantha TaxID=165200 RepID=UPI002590FFF1|nr:histone-lysine N-methyltransferase, H3 lysine-9 specific SUVH5-like [Actinidia eriantha]